MVKGIILTDRDVKLLYDCYQNVTLSFSQIHKRHFEKVAKQTVNNRLTKLVKNGFILRQRVGIVLYQNDPQEIGTVFQIARKGIQFLQTRYPQENFCDEPLRLNTLTLSHDLLLTQVLDQLRSRFKEGRVIHGKLFVGNGVRAARVPDAVIVEQSGDPVVAIELELTAKSDRRYIEIVNQYQHQATYPKVLYVVGNESIAEKIRYQVTGRKVIPGLPSLPTSKFYFVTLDHLLRDGFGAPISNGSSDLLLAA